MQEETSPTSPHLWGKAFILSLSSFLYGYTLASLNSCMGKDDKGSLLADLELTTLEQAFAGGTVIVLGSWLGVSCSSFPTEALGPRKMLLLNNLHFIAGAVLCAIVNKWALFAGRFLLGVGVGFESMIVPLLLAEISPNHLRGTVTLLHQLQVTLGILCAGVVGYFLVTNVEAGWRYVQIGAGLPAVLQLLFFWYVPDSPRTLLKNNDEDGARKLLESIRMSSDDVEGELVDMQEEQAAEGEGQEEQGVSWKEVFKQPRPLIVGFGLLFFQAATGINAVVFYSTTIFGFAGVESPILGTVAFGTVNVLATLLSVLLVDRLGRRTLLLGGTSVMALSLIGTGVLLRLPSSDIQGILAVVGVLLYTCGFAIGLGAVSWVVMNEVVPTRVRKKASSAFLSLNFFVNLVIGFFTLTVIQILGGCGDGDCTDEQEQTGVANLFFVFSGIAVVGVLFIGARLPETKGKSLEQIMDLFAPELAKPLLAENGEEEGSSVIQ